MPTNIPDGHYRARCKSAELCLTSAGNEQIQAIFELLDPDYDGVTVPWWGFFTEKTAERTMQSLRYCGWQGDDLTSLEGVSTNEVSVEVEQNTYNGKTNPRVAWVNRVGSGELKVKAPMADAQKKAFAKRMKALAIKTGKEVADNPAPKVDETDDVGF
jgi:hypothetical protein